MSIIMGSNNTIAGNLISGNVASGLVVSTDSGTPGTGNVIRGNKIGTNAAGTAAVPNQADGVSLSAAVGITLGGTAPGFDRGFEVYDAGFRLRRRGADRYQTVERRGGDVVNHALSWLSQLPNGPFFLWVHLYDAHDPYDPPEPFKSRFASHLYDGEIAYADACVGQARGRLLLLLFLLLQILDLLLQRGHVLALLLERHPHEEVAERQSARIQRQRAGAPLARVVVGDQGMGRSRTAGFCNADANPQRHELRERASGGA